MDLDYFVKGAVSGATGILLSHPIDTIKSNFQDGKPVRFNPRFLFRGIYPPFFGMGLEKSIVFGTYYNMKLYLGNSISDRAVAGAIAGFAASFVVTPIERLKILSQTNNKSLLLKDIFRPSFLFRGLSSTFTREMPGFAIYFSSYEGIKDILSSRKELSMVDHFVMGGISGFLAWFFIYPQDLVKTQIQASVMSRGYISIIKDIYKNYGAKGFFRGFPLALLRAVPLHAGTFAMYEYLNSKY